MWIKAAVQQRHTPNQVVNENINIIGKSLHSSEEHEMLRDGNVEQNAATSITKGSATFTTMKEKKKKALLNGDLELIQLILKESDC